MQSFLVISERSISVYCGYLRDVSAPTGEAVVLISNRLLCARPEMAAGVMSGHCARCVAVLALVASKRHGKQWTSVNAIALVPLVMFG